MRDFKFTEQEHPTMANFNARFDAIAALANGLGNEYVWAKSNDTGIVGYVNSPDPNAYPPSVSDGYTYKALGQLGAKVQIATGSYTGTGKYGSGNKNRLTFDFVPKFVFVEEHSIYDPNILPLLNGMTDTSIVGKSSSYWHLSVTWSENTVSWWAPNGTEGGNQMNSSGTVYSYIAIG